MSPSASPRTVASAIPSALISKLRPSAATAVGDGDDAPLAEELRSPYLEEGQLDLAAWARDSLALALPPQILCGEDCRGLCDICGENLNRHPDHAHEKAPDPRWAALSEIEFD